MKKILVAAALLGLAVGNVAYAQNQPYFGVKGGFMSLDGGGDDAINIGGIVGVKMQDLPASSGLRGSISLEGEATITVADGDVAGGDWNVMTFAGYGVFRSTNPGNVYFKGKAGLAYQDIEVDQVCVSYPFVGTVCGGGGSSSDFGVGFKMGARNALEVEYTILDDVDFLSVGYNF
jgi:hypothetical protein